MDAVKLLGALLGSGGGGGGNLLGKVLGGGGGQPQQQSGGAADLLRGLLGGGGAPQQQQSSGGGGAMDLLGGLLGGGGGGGQQGGGSNNMLGGLLKAAIAKKMGGGGGGGGGGAMDLLGGLLGGGAAAAPEPEPQVSAPQRQAVNDQAKILIRAMCNSAKSDGQVDQAEQQAIIGRLGELDQQEVDFLQQEMAAPLDVNSFARSVPREMAPQVYALSVMTVKVDTREEVQYLTQLAQGLGLDQPTLDAIHKQAGLA